MVPALIVAVVTLEYASRRQRSRGSNCPGEKSRLTACTQRLVGKAETG